MSQNFQRNVRMHEKCDTHENQSDDDDDKKNII